MQMITAWKGFSVFPALKHKQADHLRRAAAEGNVAWINRILSGRTPADPKKKEHTSALQMACRFGHTDAVKALVAKGADVNRIGPDGTALMEAAMFGHEQIVRFLLENKADPRLGANGDLPVHSAARFDRTAIIRILEQQPGGQEIVVAPNAEGKTPLMMACCVQDGSNEAASFLIEHGADITAVDQAGNTPMHMAAISGNAAVAEVLLSHPKGDALVRAANGQGRRALHIAVLYGQEAVARALLERKPDLAAVDKDGCTALHMLCKSVMFGAEGRDSVARMMLEGGADPGAKDSQGNSSMDYASSESLRQLLRSSIASTSSGGAADEQPVRAPAQVVKAAASKKEKMQEALQEGLASAGVSLTEKENSSGAPAPSGTEAFLIKEALRKHTSEEPDGWKLGSEVSPQ